MHVPPDATVVAPADLVVAGQALRDGGLTEEAVAGAEAIAPRQLDVVRLPLVHEALTRRDDAAAVLLRCFVYDDAVGEEELRAAVGAPALDVLRAVGLVVAGDGGLSAPGRVIPFLGVLVAADVPYGNADVVMPPGPTTMQLGRLLPDDGLGRRARCRDRPGVAGARGGHARWPRDGHRCERPLPCVRALQRRAERARHRMAGGRLAHAGRRRTLRPRRRAAAVHSPPRDDGQRHLLAQRAGGRRARVRVAGRDARRAHDGRHRPRAFRRARA